MALNLKLAEGYVELSVMRHRYDADMAKVQRELAKLPGTHTVNIGVNAGAFRKDMIGVRAELAKLRTFQIGIRIDRVRAASDLNLIRQQAELLQRRSFGTIPIRADLRPWRSAMKTIAFDLYRVRRFANIPIATNTSAAHSNLNLLLQQVKAIQGESRLSFGRGSGGGGGGGGGSNAGQPGFLSGLWMGAGGPYAANGRMMAGQLTGGGLRASLSTAVEMQSQMAELRRVSGMSAADAQGYKKSLFGIGTSQAGVSIPDLMEISLIGGRAGIGEREGSSGLLTFTKDVALVKNAIGDMPTAELAESMMRVLNVFELGTDRVAGFGSALTAMDNASVASAQDILDISRRLSGTAHAIGITLPQVLAFSSVLKDVGLSNEVAGSSFSQIFRKMATDSHAFAEQIGIDARDFANAYRRDPMEALGLVIGKFNEFKDTLEGQAFLKELGLEGDRVTGSIQQLASKFDEVEKRAKVASTETGTLNSLMEANALKSDTLASSYQKLENAMTALSDAMGQAFLEPVTAATNALAGFIQTINQGDLKLLKDTLTLSLIPQFLRGGQGNTDSIRQRMEEWFAKSILGANLSAPAIGAAAANPLPAKNPNPPPPQPPPDFTGQNLLLGSGKRALNALGILTSTQNALIGTGAGFLGQVLKDMPQETKKQQTYSSGLSASDVRQRIQNDILNMKDNSTKETAKNTFNASKTLTEMLEILKRGGTGVTAALLNK